MPCSLILLWLMVLGSKTWARCTFDEDYKVEQHTRQLNQTRHKGVQPTMTHGQMQSKGVNRQESKVRHGSAEAHLPRCRAVLVDVLVMSCCLACEASSWSGDELERPPSDVSNKNVKRLQHRQIEWLASWVTEGRPGCSASQMTVTLPFTLFELASETLLCLPVAQGG